VNTCATGTTYCPGLPGQSGQCVSTQTDANNCGVCGNICGVGGVCALGQCQGCSVDGPTPDACEAGGVSRCTNFLTDPNNCGHCGGVCTGSQFCAGGTCGTACTGGTAACFDSALGASACFDLQRSDGHCGNCNTSCAPGVSCVAGACTPPCAVGETLCRVTGTQLACVDTQTDANNCGTCGNTCAPGRGCAQGTCATSCSAQDVVAYYKLDGQPATQGTTQAGSPGGALTLTTLDTSDKSVPGFLGQALLFDGIDDQAQGQGPSVGTGDFTVAVWVNFLDATRQSVLVSQGGYCTATGWLLDMNVLGGGSLRLATSLNGTDNGSVETSAGAFSVDGLWHHVAASVVRGGASTLYVDGNVAGASTGIGAADLTNTLLTLGNNSVGCASGLNANAEMDEVRIYLRALTQPEVVQLAAGCTGP
jgi:hypothetical protein